MNTCPTCQNDLVYHDQGECLRPTPETDLIAGHKNDVYKFATEPKWDYVVPSDFARTLERQRDEAREHLSSLVCCILKRGGKGVFDITAMDRLQELQNAESELHECRELLASEKTTRNAIIEKGIETERQLAEAREENARLLEALQANLFHHALACVWQHQDGTFGDKTRITEDSCKCPPKVKAFRKLLGTNSENKGFDP